MTNKMNVVVLYSTGTKTEKSNTLFVVHRFLAALGCKTATYFNAHTMRFTACSNCSFCHSHPHCCKKDDMSAVYTALQTADLVVVASPMVFGTLDGDLLRLFSRLAILYGHHLQGLRHPFCEKQATFIVTAGQDWLNMFLPCEATFPIMLNHLNAVESGRLYARKTNFTHISEQHDALPLLEQHCKEAAHLVQTRYAEELRKRESYG